MSDHEVRPTIPCSACGQAPCACAEPVRARVQHEPAHAGRFMRLILDDGEDPGGCVEFEGEDIVDVGGYPDSPELRAWARAVRLAPLRRRAEQDPPSG
ncbi:MAG TPA: hypothetical protein VNI83_15240 [Vicinamibacterales bacterium]|nr:hypothetical protein [Vicinamibacterales bacterium]